MGAKYAGEYASRIFASAELGALPVNDVDDTIAKLSKYGCPQGSQHFDLYCRMAQEVLSRNEDQIKSKGEPGNDEAGYVETLRMLREILFTVIQQPAKFKVRVKSNKGVVGTLGDSSHRPLHCYALRVPRNDAHEMSAALAVLLLHHVAIVHATRHTTSLEWHARPRDGSWNRLSCSITF